MYYISENKKDLEYYNDLVTKGENYSGTTQQWCDVIKHKEKELFAIIVNEKYIIDLETIENLNDWHNLENL